jgi:hypothetical protein
VALGFSLSIGALGAALIFKSYHNLSWNQFFQKIFAGTPIPTVKKGA